jgi:DNA-directed RNA polymerase specialized sigma24 family protein
MIGHTRENDEDRLVSIYRSAFPACAKMIHRMGGTLEQAKDCFHDALLIFMEKEKAGSLQLRSSPEAYLLGTAKICWLRFVNGTRTFPLPDEFETVEPQEETSEEKEKAILRYLQSAGKKCLELLSAFYYERSSLHDIAIRFGFKGRRSATVQKFKCLEKVRENVKTSYNYAE